MKKIIVLVCFSLFTIGIAVQAQNAPAKKPVSHNNGTAVKKPSNAASGTSIKEGTPPIGQQAMRPATLASSKDLLSEFISGLENSAFNDNNPEFKGQLVEMVNGGNDLNSLSEVSSRLLGFISPAAFIPEWQRKSAEWTNDIKDPKNFGTFNHLLKTLEANIKPSNYANDWKLKGRSKWLKEIDGLK